jgi:hypothetical protein
MCVESAPFLTRVILENNFIYFHFTQMYCKKGTSESDGDGTAAKMENSELKTLKHANTHTNKRTSKTAITTEKRNRKLSRKSININILCHYPVSTRYRRPVHPCPVGYSI